MAEADATTGTPSTQSAEPGQQASGPTGESTPTTLLSQQGNVLLDWREGAPENLRTASIVQRLATREAAMQALVQQDQMLGRALFLPEETADATTKQTAMQKVYDKLGRPAKASEYVLEAPEGKAWDKTISDRWQQAFYQHGLSQTQVDGIMGEYWRSVEAAEQIKAGREAESYSEGRNKLHAEFGASTEQIVGKARMAAEHFGKGAFSGNAGVAFWEELMQATLPDGSRLANSPHMIATLAAIGDRLGEGTWFDSDFYVPGQNTMETLTARSKELTTKRHAGTITQDEQAELMKINTQIVAHRERTGRAA